MSSRVGGGRVWREREREKEREPAVFHIFKDPVLFD
jgi:hypothetical protein